ncbi:hypothetical protein [Steroidobacter sp.]|uniref:hypothetical protein n=1 Tax=Steroidobacter sp. TaxID=1978227 RepID=UPI001A5DA207|nr:hypothetical protein [Steroidobacter sp.]MBL8269415.1 hypothetical protein [Steroidobacter sp.]
MRAEIRRVICQAIALIVLAAALTSLVEADPLPCSPPQSPQACYERYLQAIPKATQLRDLYMFLSSDRVRQLERGLAVAQAKGVDPRQIERETLTMLRQGSSRPERIRVHRYEREAGLRVERADVITDVRLMIEDGQWRIADERVRANPRF